MRLEETPWDWSSLPTEMARWEERNQLSLWPLALVAGLETGVLSVWPATRSSYPGGEGPLRMEANLAMTSLALAVTVASPEAKVTSDLNLMMPRLASNSTRSGFSAA